MLEAKHISLTELTLSDGFWKKRQEINRNVTARAVYERFRDTGRFDAIACNWQEGMPNRPHEYWDSDVAKWIEGVAYITARKKAPELEKIVDETVDNIEKNMLPCGYFNSYYINLDPDARFTNRNNHELYCLGHFIEAAIAYRNATGKDKLFSLILRYVDYVYEVFLKEKSAKFFTPGHQEIELALFKLYKETEDRRHLELCRYFIEERGRHEEHMFLPEHPNGFYPDAEFQSHKPVREQREAEGHCVRALYMYSAMADLAGELGDEELLDVCKALFEDITERKMYITGGVGSDRYGERFTHAYDLPNDVSYTETCAAIAMMYFCRRMSELEIDAKYADIIERVMYNGMLSGVSLDGRKFFYTNPLETDPRLLSRYDIFDEPPTYQPIQQRVEVFECSCCPPNILRHIASIEEYFYSVSGDTVFVNQFGAGDLNCGNVKITQKTEYPKNGDISFSVSGDIKNLAIRIPAWCDNYIIDRPFEIKNGYAYIENPQGEINVSFEMEPFFVQANPNVIENGGRVALCRGPIVYCGEAPAGTNLRSLRFTDDNFIESFDEEIGAITLIGKLEATSATKDFGLYRKYTAADTEKEIEFIPYYSFANHGEQEMLVWFNI